MGRKEKKGNTKIFLALQGNYLASQLFSHFNCGAKEITWCAKENIELALPKMEKLSDENVGKLMLFIF